MKTPIIVALDHTQEEVALSLVRKLSPELCHLKVNTALFTKAGPSFIEKLQQLKFNVFLDLKFHDIPNTVFRAVKSAAELGVWMLNVHALGGKEMLLAAREAIPKTEDAPKLIAVTILTSMNQAQLQSLHINLKLTDMVMHLGILTHDAGLDGVVCSALESESFRVKYPNEFCLVTPGIRLPSDANSDQSRVMTPQSALESGSDYLVIGRSITAATSPVTKLKEIYSQISAL